jgi:hypothetical protein
VNNGHATLTGVVANSMDKSVAEIQANQTSAFSVTNDLVIETKAQEKEYKSKK